MAQNYHTIVLPTRPQTDTVISIFLLKHFGEKLFPGIAEAKTEVWSVLPECETESTLNAKGIIPIDIGGGIFDHHNKNEKTTATDLVMNYLDMAKNSALTKLVEFARRDDFFGKGIVSSDSLDRAFGLPGLLANLNKLYPNDPEKVVSIVSPLIEAHIAEETQRTKKLPEEVEKIRKNGKAWEFTVRQRDKNLRVIVLESDNISLAGYLRSQIGGRHDVVAQWLLSGHLNILTRPTKRVRLDALAGAIRLEEISKSGKECDLTETELCKPGRLHEAPEWYYDPATNSIQNGGVNPAGTEPTKISHEKIIEVIRCGLEGRVVV